MKQFPGFADTFESLIKEMHQGTTLLRMHMESLCRPWLRCCNGLLPGPTPSALHPASSFMEMNLEAAEISTAPVPRASSRFRRATRRWPLPSFSTGWWPNSRGRLPLRRYVTASSTRHTPARSAHNLVAAEENYNAAFERTISKEKQRLSPVALEVATFFMEQREPEKAEAVLERALDAEDAAGQPVSMEIPVLMRLRDVEQSRRNVPLTPVEIRLVKAWESVAGPESVVVANNLYSLSGSLEQAGQFEKPNRLSSAASRFWRGITASARPQSASHSAVCFDRNQTR